MEHMPYRQIPLVTDEIYHVYNRGVAKGDIFLSPGDYKHFTALMNYYRFRLEPGDYSGFCRLPREDRQNIWQELIKNKDYRVDILAYCLMPNHFHLLLYQIEEQGITKFIRKLCNSYSHFFNLVNDRVGGLFQGPFKGVHITSQEQLIHTSRYIHLNPFSSGLVMKISELSEYRYSSYLEYINPKSVLWPVCSTEHILDLFGQGKNNYENFVINQADYQRSLEHHKHLYIDI